MCQSRRGGGAVQRSGGRSGPPEAGDEPDDGDRFS